MASEIKIHNVLVIEDSDVKWREIERLVQGIGVRGVVRAATIEDANAEVARGIWDLVILGISLDIRSSSSGPGAGGHDTTGGLKIAERMYYLGYDAPTIIVTAFDSFPTGHERREAVLGIQDVVEEATQLLGSLLVGWVRYGAAGWEGALLIKIRGVLGA